MNRTDPDVRRTAPGDAARRPAAPPGTREQDQEVRQRPWYRQARVLVVAVAAMAVAASVVVVLIRWPEQPAATSPLDILAGALTRTSADSYSFSLDTTVQVAGRNRDSDAVYGVADPGRHLGMEQIVAHSAGRTTRAQIRFAGADLYTLVPAGSGFGKPWDESLAAAVSSATPPGELYGFVSDRPVSPEALAVVLRAAGTSVRAGESVSGPGWTGTAYRLIASVYGGRETVTGTVYVDRWRHVRHLTITTVEEGRAATGNASSLVTTRDITFGDFGTTVSVTAPPASQVQYTSGQPYWGLYF